MLAGVGVVRGRREGEVQRQLEGLFGHVGDDAVEQRAGALQAGVGVDLDQPWLELVVYHEVQPEYLEVVHAVARRNLGKYAPDRVSAHLLHFRQDLLPKVVLLPSVSPIQIPLKLLITDLIKGLKLMVVGVAFLHCVVGEMYLWLKVADVELIGGGADVALFVPVCAGDSEEVGDHHVVADVELAVVVEQGAVDVHLHDVGALGLLFAQGGVAAARGLALLDQRVQLVDLVDYGDPSALVAVLPWLYDPDVAHLVPHHSALVLLLLLLPLHQALPAAVELHEPRVLGVLEALADVEGERQVVEHVLADERVVLPEVVEEGLLVAEVEVVDEVVVDGVGLILGQHRLELFVEVLDSEGVLPLFVFLEVLQVGLVKLLVCFAEELEGELLVLAALELVESHPIGQPHLAALLRHLLLLLVFQSRLGVARLLLLLEHLTHFQLRPHELAIAAPLLHNAPPEPALEQSPDHGAVVARSDVGLPLPGPVGDVVVLEVEVEVDVVAEHVLPQELEVALYALVVDYVLLLSDVALGALQALVEVLLGSPEDALLLLALTRTGRHAQRVCLGLELLALPVLVLARRVPHWLQFDGRKHLSLVHPLRRVLLADLGSRIARPPQLLRDGGVGKGFDLDDIESEATHAFRRGPLAILVVGPEQGLDAVVDLVLLVVVSLDELDIDGQLGAFPRALELYLPRDQLLVPAGEHQRSRAGEVEFAVSNLFGRKSGLVLSRLLHLILFKGASSRRDEWQGRAMMEGWTIIRGPQCWRFLW